jgi:hypothetical protein
MTLVFPRARLVVSSRSYAGLGAPRDQDEAYGRFCRALLLRAAAAAPDARFVRAPPPLAGGLLGAMALLAGGAALLALSALAAGASELGLDLGARLLFVALLLGCAWPWLADERRRAFDPTAVPAILLPTE